MYAPHSDYRRQTSHSLGTISSYYHPPSTPHAPLNSDLTERSQVSAPCLAYGLDLLPLHRHDQFARQLYRALRSRRPGSSDHNGGDGGGEAQAIVTFSTISAPLVLLSTTTLCGLPFFLSTPPAEPTPVLHGLRRAVKSMNSVAIGPRTAREEGRLAVVPVEDSSETYAGVLVETIKRMEGDADFWQRLVDEVGVGGWRRGMLCVELEAALYKAGLRGHSRRDDVLSGSRVALVIPTVSDAGPRPRCNKIPTTRVASSS